MMTASVASSCESYVHPLDVMYVDVVRFFICQNLPISAHPSCQIGLFLNLRATHRRGFQLISTLAMIRRINAAVTKVGVDGRANLLVRSWAKHVIESGWLFQVWPAVKVNHDGQLLRRCPGSTTGLPHGMRQSYFDAANDQKKFLGWRVDIVYRLEAPRCRVVDNVSMELSL